MVEFSYDLGQVTYPSTGQGRVVSNSKRMQVPLWVCRLSFTFKAGKMSLVSFTSKDEGMSPLSCSSWFLLYVSCSISLGRWELQLFSYLT